MHASHLKLEKLSDSVDLISSAALLLSSLLSHILRCVSREVKRPELRREVVFLYSASDNSSVSSLSYLPRIGGPIVVC